MTHRALEVLKSADVIAAEDTRIASRLLSHYGISPRAITALHEHNEARAVPKLLDSLAAGRSIALVSDAGTPAFSDPGARLVAAARERDVPVVPVPGPNAAAAAFSASGFTRPQFLFYGFLPAKAGERRKALRELATIAYPLMFYEAPHRIGETLADLEQTLGGERRIVIARELTKLFETIHACSLAEATAWLLADANRSKGEFVLIVEGAGENEERATEEARTTLEVLLEELPVKQAAALAAKITGARKNDLYQLALTLKGR